MSVARYRKSHHVGTKDDVNLLPLMNLFIVLIPTLLLSAAYLKLSAVDVGLAGGPVADANMIRDLLDLRVEVGGDHLRVTAVGMDENSIARDAKWRESLASMLTQVAQSHPESHGVTVVSRPETRYEEVIQVMDVARAAGFREVSLQAVDAAASNAMVPGESTSAEHASPSAER